MDRRNNELRYDYNDWLIEDICVFAPLTPSRVEHYARTHFMADQSNVESTSRDRLWCGHLPLTPVQASSITGE